MKKTISTSIGGIVFNVEEDAHDKLASYLNAISASLKDSDGHNEIMSDIESRVAEILQQKVSAYKQVITIAEVDEVIGIMGKPEDFGAATDGAKEQADSYTGSHYGTSGRRRVYRDTDDNIFFGVCSGLSHHFGIDPIWLRLGFILSTFIGGFGVILYILLAIITRKARTTAEKLEMMGEPVDVNNIRKIIEDEMEHIKKKVSAGWRIGSEIKYGKTKDKANEFGKNAGDFFASAGQGFGRFVGGIIKGILMFIVFVMLLIFAYLLLALIVSLTTGVNKVYIHAGAYHYSVIGFIDMLSGAGSMRALLIIGVFLFSGIPLLALVVRFGRAVMGRKQPFHWFTITASILWALGWILMFVGVVAIFSHFSVTDFTRNDVQVNSQSSKIMYIKMENERVGEDNTIDLDSLNIYVYGQNELVRGTPSLCIELSPDSNYHLILTKIARGITKLEADDFADAIDYSYSSHDSTLVLDPYFSLEQNKGWRKQRLDLSLEVPLNKSIALPKGIDHILCSALHHKGQTIGGEKWTMTQAGLVPLNK